MASQRPYLQQDDRIGQPVIVMPPDDDGKIVTLTIQEAHQWLADNVEMVHVDACLYCDVADLVDGIR